MFYLPLVTQNLRNDHTVCVCVFHCSFGTCGGISDDAVPGSIVVASKGSACVNRNADGFARYYAAAAGAGGGGGGGNDDNISYSQAYTLTEVRVTTR